MELRERIAASAIEIFTTMVMMEVAVAEDIDENYGKLANSITGVIGLTGNYKGVLAVHLPHQVAFAITGNFLGVEVSEMNEDVEDAIGEIANMIGGNVKSMLSEKGRDIDLSLPSTVSGKEYGFHSIKGAEKTVIPFRAAEGIFYVELQLET
ncbi:MAG: chemotaxis protein CheX [Desulfocapsaceae bacterium]|nr:chemotaxis protein CheX [Desulfocapsaceae bacterium]